MKTRKRGKGAALFRFAAGAALMFYVGPKLIRALNRSGRLATLFGNAVTRIDHAVGWHRLPTWAGVLSLIAIRNQLRSQNLYSTGDAVAPLRSGGRPIARPEPAEHDEPEAVDTTPDEPSPFARSFVVRTPDGSYNDLNNPDMGRAGTRFGRNVPLDYTYPDAGEDLLKPNPRAVSRELLTRHEFIPATTLNVIAAVWLQFMTRDWFSHGNNDHTNQWEVPLDDDDKWHENPMRIPRIQSDPTRTPAEEGLPPTHINVESHWWDASQIYGNSLEEQRQIRAGVDGKIRLGENGLIEIPEQALRQEETLSGWWVGVALMFNLFVREHNAICDRLKAHYAGWDDELLFQHARLINAALLAKIHTVEWTPGILGHPALQIGMRANWWGIVGQKLNSLARQVGKNEVLTGIPGSPTNHFGVPYSITEEFVAVYRMHPLIPDDYDIRSATTDELIRHYRFPELTGLHTDGVMQQVQMSDLLYSLGVAHPGAVTLHNYPRGLQTFERPDGDVIDLAAIDILRSRELGVPRYNQFRRLLHMKPVTSFAELTSNPQWAREIRAVYDGNVERVDLMVGLFAENPPVGFGFSDTAFRIFVLMASRRLNSDRFFTMDFTPDVYTPIGMEWIEQNTMSTVLLRHFPELEPALHGVKNAFAPWQRLASVR